MFDTVWHEALLFHMYKMVINGKMFKFYKFIYSNLRARIVVNGISTQIIRIMRGILQGGESSPTLFNIMINGIISALKKTDGAIKMESKHCNLVMIITIFMY